MLWYTTKPSFFWIVVVIRVFIIGLQEEPGGLRNGKMLEDLER